MTGSTNPPADIVPHYIVRRDINTVASPLEYTWECACGAIGCGVGGLSACDVHHSQHARERGRAWEHLIGVTADMMRDRSAHRPCERCDQCPDCGLCRCAP